MESDELFFNPVLDLLGDIGGLSDALKLIASTLVSLCTQGSLKDYLISKIFYEVPQDSKF